MRPFAKLFLFGLTASLLAGCARVGTVTTIHADGSFDRKVVYTADAAAPGPPPDVKAGEPQPMMGEKKLEDLFKIPAPSASVQVTKGKDGESQTITVSRKGEAGAALQDITVLDDSGKPMVTSSVTVTKLPTGQLEYVETLHWAGEKPPMPAIVSPDIRMTVKQALPESFRITELIDRVAVQVTINGLLAVAGPPDPVLFELMFNRDAALLRLRGKLFVLNTASLQREIPELKEAAAKDIARLLLDILNMKELDKSKSGPDKPNTGGANSASPLTFSIAFPGTVVETNGLTEPSSGNVYWSLFPLALVASDIKLRAVIQP